MVTTTFHQPRIPRVADDAMSRKLIVAIYMLSDHEGLECRAGDFDLAEAASLPLNAVADRLDAMRAAGWVEILNLGPPHPEPGRRIVLMDHEAADWYVTEMRHVPVPQA